MTARAWQCGANQLVLLSCLVKYVVCRFLEYLDAGSVKAERSLIVSQTVGLFSDRATITKRTLVQTSLWLSGIYHHRKDTYLKPEDMSATILILSMRLQWSVKVLLVLLLCERGIYYPPLRVWIRPNDPSSFCRFNQGWSSVRLFYWGPWFARYWTLPKCYLVGYVRLCLS